MSEYYIPLSDPFIYKEENKLYFFGIMNGKITIAVETKDYVDGVKIVSCKKIKTLGLSKFTAIVSEIEVYTHEDSVLIRVICDDINLEKWFKLDFTLKTIKYVTKENGMWVMSVIPFNSHRAEKLYLIEEMNMFVNNKVLAIHNLELKRNSDEYVY